MYCLNCHYDLHGLDSDRCPECGRFFNPADEKSFTRKPKATPVRDFLERVGKALEPGPSVFSLLQPPQDPDQQLRVLRRHNPFIGSIESLQQQNELMRAEIQWMLELLSENDLIDAASAVRVQSLLEEPEPHVLHVADDSETPPPPAQDSSPELLELQRAAQTEAPPGEIPAATTPSTPWDGQLR